MGNLAQGVALSSFVLRWVTYPARSRFKFYQIAIWYPIKHRRKKTRRLPGCSFVFVLVNKINRHDHIILHNAIKHCPF